MLTCNGCTIWCDGLTLYPINDDFLLLALKPNRPDPRDLKTVVHPLGGGLADQNAASAARRKVGMLVKALQP